MEIQVEEQRTDGLAEVEHHPSGKDGTDGIVLSGLSKKYYIMKICIRWWFCWLDGNVTFNSLLNCEKITLIESASYGKIWCWRVTLEHIKAEH